MRQSIDTIWEEQISSKNRNMIRKAEKNGLIYSAEYDFASIDQFVDLYTNTMTRLNADAFYFFADTYYCCFSQNLQQKAFLGTVRMNEKTIGAALFMYSEHYGHYHLAGSDREYSSLGINNFLLWKTIEELKKHNISEFHLGGGTSSDTNDSLYSFKKSFSAREMGFYIGKWIFDRNLYRDICEEWSTTYPELKEKYQNILLKYRYHKRGYYG